MKTEAIGSSYTHLLVQTGVSPQTEEPFSGLCEDLAWVFVAIKVILLLRLVAVKRLDSLTILNGSFAPIASRGIYFVGFPTPGVWKTIQVNVYFCGREF
jgi:hypothetical protein